MKTNAPIGQEMLHSLSLSLGNKYEYEARVTYP